MIGRADLEIHLEAAIARAGGDDNPELKVECLDHEGEGSDVWIEDGLALCLCRSCGRINAQIEISNEPRQWGRDLPN